VLGTRLQEALAGWGGPRKGIRSLERKLKERTPPVPGSSRTMIHQYIAGKVEPSLAFVSAAAEILGVREAWLAFGEGEPQAKPTDPSEAFRGRGSAPAGLLEQD
jgi:transcriptional regulator with XRE-family HTH domain